MEGAAFLAVSNISLTLDAPTPTSISINSLPAMDKNCTPASPATALASKVFPTPAGPTKRAPFGIFAPKARYFPGFFKKSTNSANSCLASLTPAISSNFVDGLSRSNIFALLLENDKIPSPALLACLRKKKKNPTRRRIGKKICSKPNIVSLVVVFLLKTVTSAGFISAAFKVSVNTSPA